MPDESRHKEFRLASERRFDRLTKSFNDFVSGQVSAAVLLIAVTGLALFAANSSFHDHYQSLEKLRLGLNVGGWSLEKTLHHWVNDGLMVLFFFILGLEIKREIIAGELRSWRQSSVVFLAAIGGMAFPALIYATLNAGSDTQSGWGIPMATDAAFALGALALLGNRLPTGLKVFLVALAIIDDIGAILVIALFYTDAVDFSMLMIAAAFWIALCLSNFLGVRYFLPYLLLSLGLWLGMLQSGIHATLAGVLAALTIPARPVRHPQQMADTLRAAASQLEGITSVSKKAALADTQHHQMLEEVSQQSKQTRTTLRIWENRIDRPVNLLIIPLFAFLNAGIVLSVDIWSDMTSSALGLGIVLGLLIGKPLGITLMSALAIRLGVGLLPQGVTLMQILAVGMLAGMGFTMSMFMSALSFAGQPELLTEAKASIMLATLIAGSLGLGMLLYCSRQSRSESAPESTTNGNILAGES